MLGFLLCVPARSCLATYGLHLPPCPTSDLQKHKSSSKDRKRKSSKKSKKRRHSSSSSSSSDSD